MRLKMSRRTLSFLCLLAALFCLLYGLVPDGSSRPAAVVADQPTATPVTGLPAAQIDTYPYEASTPVPLPGQDGSGSGALASRSGASQGATNSDAVTCSDIHCIQHVVVLVLENQSFDRLYGAFSNPNGASVSGIPMVNGAPAPSTCLPDPRQPTVVTGSGTPTPTPWPCLAPYSHVDPYTPTPIPLGPYTGPYDQYDNPHHMGDSITDVTGVAPSQYYRPGSVPTPMTGFLASAWAECLNASAPADYRVNNPACQTPTAGQDPSTMAPFDAMRYMTGPNIPIYWAYAQYYTLADHMFGPSPSYSLPNHLYLLSDWSATCPISGTPIPPTATPPPPPQPTATSTACYSNPGSPDIYIDQPGVPLSWVQRWPQYAWTDITYLLNNHQVDGQGNPVAQGTPAPVSWKYYVATNTFKDCPHPTPSPTPVPSGPAGASCDTVAQPSSGTVEYWNPLPFFTTVNADGTPVPGFPTPLAGGPGQTGYVQKYPQLYDDILGGTLPSVSWVMPSLLTSDHPPYSLTYGYWPAEGQDLLAWLIQTLSTAPGQEDQWNHTAIFVTWDDWGGFYDHVVPPTPVPTVAPASMPDPGYGIRVPLMIISPYANHCAVDSRPMSFEAITRFIEDDFLGGARLNRSTDGRPDLRPGVRETGTLAPDLSQDFTWSRSTFDTDGVGVGPGTPTPTPVPYGQTYPPPTSGWCIS